MEWLRQLRHRIQQLLGRGRLGGAKKGLKTSDERSTESTRSFSELRGELESLVWSGERQKSERLLHEVRQRFPIPAIDILPKDVWGTATDQLVVRTHESVDIAEAVRNMERSGRKLDDEEKNYLKILASHWCKWSPTVAEHRNDPWVLLIRHAYPGLDGLEPVFDSLIWPNEIARYPLGYVPMRPWLFLFAAQTGFYIYDFQGDTMFEAGGTLRQVIDGMRNQRWTLPDMWDDVPCTFSEDPSDYFPVYEMVKHTAQEHPLEYEIREFTL